MTTPIRTEIEKMEPGGAMDAWIASYVLGYKVYTNLPTVGEMGAIDVATVPGRRFYERINTMTNSFYDQVPCFSTEIAAAWQVVEKLSDWAFNITRFASDAGEWAGSVAVQAFLRPNANGGIGPTQSVRVEAPTLPLAICRVALLAIQTGYQPTGELYATEEETTDDNGSRSPRSAGND